MKTINVFFTNEEYDLLKEAKKKLNWHDFILSIIDNEVKNK